MREAGGILPDLSFASITMTLKLKRQLVSVFSALCIAAITAPAPAHAAKVMELRAEHLMFAANDIKKSLDLTPNQQTLWQQVASKSATLLRTRQQRRDRLQADLKTRLAGAQPELRELASGIDEEASASAIEDRQLREMWLTVNDALNDQQRATVMQILLSHLERVDDPERGPKGGREQRPPAGGRGGQRPGGMGGPPRS